MQRVGLLLLAILAVSHARVGEMADNEREKDGRQLEEKKISFRGKDPNFILDRCEGDCDDDDDCSSNLICFQRDGGEEVPGCSGGRDSNSRTDYCIHPDDEGGSTPNPPTPNPPTPSPPTPNPPTPGPPTPNPPTGGPPLKIRTPPNLDICEGDCDKDSDCKSHLYCFQREKDDPVPGCSGQDGSRTDYCIPRNGSPTPNPPTPNPPTPSPPSPTPPSPTPPTGGNDFRLKLYWEEGYYWQEEKVERKWCMECKGSGCSRGEKLYIYTCGSGSQDFDFVGIPNNRILIQLHGTNNCLDRDGNSIRIQTCDENKQDQQWFAQRGSFGGDKFEISPVGDSVKCITQRHHPKAGEEVKLESCTTARSGDTSYWNKY